MGLNGSDWDETGTPRETLLQHSMKGLRTSGSPASSATTIAPSAVSQRSARRPEIAEMLTPGLSGYVEMAGGSRRRDDALRPGLLNSAPYSERTTGIVHHWISNMGPDDRGFGTHSLRRAKVAQLIGRQATSEQFNCYSATRVLHGTARFF
jgi:hypothetical protein